MQTLQATFLIRAPMKRCKVNTVFHTCSHCILHSLNSWANPHRIYDLSRGSRRQFTVQRHKGPRLNGTLDNCDTFCLCFGQMFLLTCEQASFFKRIREEGPPDRTWKVEKGQTPRLNGLVDLCPTNGSKSWQILFPINTNELYSKIKTDGKSFLPPLFVCRIANFQKCKWWKFAFN